MYSKSKETAQPKQYLVDEALNLESQVLTVLTSRVKCYCHRARFLPTIRLPPEVPSELG